MEELIEIVFEDVGKHALTLFVTELTDYGKAVKDYHVLPEHGKTDWQDVARTVEKTIPAGSAWHRDLLLQMSAEVGNVRLSLIHI